MPLFRTVVALALVVVASSLAACSASEETEGLAQSEDELRRDRTLSCDPSGDPCEHEAALGFCIEGVESKTSFAAQTGKAPVTVERRARSGTAMAPLRAEDPAARASDNGFWAHWDNGASALTHSKRLSKWTSTLTLDGESFDLTCDYASTIGSRDPCATRICAPGERCEVRGRGNPKAYCVP